MVKKKGRKVGGLYYYHSDNELVVCIEAGGHAGGLARFFNLATGNTYSNWWDFMEKAKIAPEQGYRRKSIRYVFERVFNE